MFGACWKGGLFSAFICAAIFAPAAVFGQMSAEIVPLLQQQIAEQHLVGMTAVVIRGDGAAVIADAGVKRAGQSTPLVETDFFHLGSNGKAFTATMIARLVEAGKLRWTTTPLDVFPELKASMHPTLRPITLEQLLSHYAGLPPYDDTDAKEFKALPKLEGTAVEQRSKFAAWALQHAPAVKPGTKGLYSNAGFAIAGAMAERVTGSSWEELVTSQVLEPLHIRALFAWPLAVDANQPWGHAETKRDVKAVNQADKASELPLILLPAGGMAMTMGDYAKFLQEHLRALEGKGSTLLSAESIRHLHTPPAKDKYALGWGVQPVGGVTSHVHTGGAGSFYAVVALQPDKDVAVAVVANSDGDRTAVASATVLKALLMRYAAATRQ